MAVQCCLKGTMLAHTCEASARTYVLRKLAAQVVVDMASGESGEEVPCQNGELPDRGETCHGRFSGVGVGAKQVLNFPSDNCMERFCST